LSDYPTYVNAALGASARVLRCGLSLAELSHLIEKTEREIYAQTSHAIAPNQTKDYRHNLPAERSKVVSEIEAAWGVVANLAEPMIATIDEPTTEAALTRLQTQRVDGYDLFILEAMQQNDVAQVITDDGDFATIPGIQVFTANRSVIQAATAQGRLVVRQAPAPSESSQRPETGN
jgi:predicted nucleic acid-binding protein